MGNRAVFHAHGFQNSVFGAQFTQKTGFPSAFGVFVCSDAVGNNAAAYAVFAAPQALILMILIQAQGANQYV